jgi:Na+/proline symporter
MLAAKNESHAIGATFFFNILHYALRPWPWILVALASLVIYPDVASIQEAFPLLDEGKLGHDLAYSAMLTKLPSGLLGLVLASLGAAYMSTVSTHLNWGSSYVVNDFYKQQINRGASEKELVNVGRITTVILMLFSALLALVLQNALQLFDIILMFGAGTGLIFILRWFWWRINAWSEISAMFVSGIVSLLFNLTELGVNLFGGQTVAGEAVEGILPGWSKYPAVVAITTLVWVVVTFVTPPESAATLRKFYRKTRPGGPGWKKVVEDALEDNDSIAESGAAWTVPSGVLAMVLGCVLVYSCMFATGNWIYGNYGLAGGLTAATLLSAFLLKRVWDKIKGDVF